MPLKIVYIVNNDYEHMKNMIFGETPSFKEIMDTIRRMEVEMFSAY